MVLKSMAKRAVIIAIIVLLNGKTIENCGFIDLQFTVYQAKLATSYSRINTNKIVIYCHTDWFQSFCCGENTW